MGLGHPRRLNPRDDALIRRSHGRSALRAWPPHHVAGAAAPRWRRVAVAGRDRLRNLWHAERRSFQRDPVVPRADRRPACRLAPSGNGQAGLVGTDGRSGQAGRSDPAFHRLFQRDRQLHGFVRPRHGQSGDRCAVGNGIPCPDDPRHGPRAGDVARSSRDRHARRSGRRIDGRDAGAELARDVSRTRPRGRRDRLDRAPYGAKHRVP